MVSRNFRKRLRLSAVLAAIFVSTSLFAQTYYRSESGERFSATQNPGHGVILNSGRTVIYLGISCDAFSPQYGGQSRGGVWRQYADGFVVMMSGYDIRFPGQRVLENVDCSNP